MERKTYIENNDFASSLGSYLARFDALKVEEIPTYAASGRVSAKAIYAKTCDPTYNASAMDGIAVHSEDTVGASEIKPLLLTPDKFEYVNTGNAVPTFADSVVMIEDVITAQDGVMLTAPARPWQNVRVHGESVVATEMILPSHRRIRPVDIGAILASGNAVVSVFKRPSVAVIPTGNEMVETVAELAPGKLMESNTRVFAALCESYGAVANRYDIVGDEKDALKKTIEQACATHDVVVINAGSSAGTKDFTAGVISQLGSVVTHGLAIKPGKPTILAQIGSKPVIGVPGYPVSAYIVFDKVVKPLVYRLMGLDCLPQSTVTATLTKRLTSGFKNEEFVRVALGEVGSKLVASPLDRGAAAVMSMVKADGLLTIDRYTEGVEAGESVEVELYKPLSEIRRNLVIIGSHDVVIDVISDFMPVSSAHVGSLSGIFAIKSDSAHIAPIHLLDAESGEYNVAFVKKYFPGEKMALITGLGRVQGILTEKGNPKNITSVEQLRGGKISFANRQNGAGTRLLFDYLLTKFNISQNEVNGYEKEFTTHLAVATAVKNHVADCGLAVLSAANIMDLDFIPVGNEHYDFLLRAQNLEDERVKRFIEIIQSEAFKSEVEKIGGYTFDGIGNVTMIN